MASLFRPTVIRYVDKAGKQVSKGTPGAKRVREKSKTWRGRYVDSKGKTKTVSLFDSRDLSKAKLANIEQRVREELAGVRKHDPYETHRETLLMCPNCKGDGGSRDGSAEQECESCHLGAYREFLRSKGNTENHTNVTARRIALICRECGFTTLNDLAAGKVATWLKDRRESGLSPAGSNHYLVAVKAFGNWLVKDRRWPENPFAYLSRVNAKVDVRVVRRALSNEELSRVIDAAMTGAPFRDLSGSDRAMLYAIAALTGLRASELASLSEKNFDFKSEPPTLTLEAAYSKHRREDVLPLHSGLAKSLQAWLQTRRGLTRDDSGCIAPSIDLSCGDETDRRVARLFPGSWTERAADMLRRDLKAARDAWLDESLSPDDRKSREDSDFLEFETESGRADFHSLRHTFISKLAMSGVHPKLAKELARHSTITLTMDRYAHVGLMDMNAALETVPGLTTPIVVSTGNRPAAASDAISVAPQVALDSVQLTRSQELSVVSRQAAECPCPHSFASSSKDLRRDLTTNENWGCWDSNPEPKDYESSALTVELQPLCLD